MGLKSETDYQLPDFLHFLRWLLHFSLSGSSKLSCKMLFTADDSLHPMDLSHSAPKWLQKKNEEKGMSGVANTYPTAIHVPGPGTCIIKNKVKKSLLSREKLTINNQYILHCLIYPTSGSCIDSGEDTARISADRVSL